MNKMMTMDKSNMETKKSGEMSMMSIMMSKMMSQMMNEKLELTMGYGNQSLFIEHS